MTVPHAACLLHMQLGGDGVRAQLHPNPVGTHVANREGARKPSNARGTMGHVCDV